MRMLFASLVAAATLAAVTLPATEITGTTATVNGTVTDATHFVFEYQNAATPDPGEWLETPVQPVPAGGSVQAQLTGLTPNTEYRFRVVAISGADRETGNVLTFRTTNPGPPGIDGQNSHDVGTDRAVVEGRLNPRGSQTTYRFEYGTSTRYGRRTDALTLAGDAAPTVVQATLTGLRPRTTYHWRLVATNAAGTTRGRDRTFTTLRLPTAVSLSLSPRTVTWGRELNLGGRVSGTGVSRMPVQLEAQQFPFSATFAPVKTVRTGRDGGYLFTIPDLWTTTRFRVVTRTQVVAVSPVAQANTRVLVGRRVRHFSRTRARIEGSVFPNVAGTATLQRRSGGRWLGMRSKALRPRDDVRARYAFRVWRVRRVSRRYRVVVTPDQASGYVRGWSRSIKVKPRRRR